MTENLIVLLSAVWIGRIAVRHFSGRRNVSPPPRLEKIEVWLALCTLLINTAVTVIGWHLWRTGIVRFRADIGLFAWFDVLLLTFTMDLAMYFLHRLAHAPWIYPILHQTHHRFKSPRPLTLFVMNLTKP